MGLYTSIYFTPTDRTWIAPPELIRSIAAILGACDFDHFTVYREISCDPTLSEDNRYEPTLTKHGIPVEDALPLMRADSSYWTHMMFPCRNFTKGLMAELEACLPDSLSGGFTPWDTSISNGHWAIWSYDDGILTDYGVCAFTMSANGCPTDLALYLERFLAVDGIKQLKHKLESLSNQPWTVVINLT